MNASSINKAGVYLVRAPQQVCVNLDQRLLIVFSVRYPKISGVVLYNPAAPLNELYLMLDILYQRIDDLDIEPGDISIKAFGMKNPSLAIMHGLSQWIQQRRLRLTVTDTGKHMSRTCLIDGETGRVGVNYLENPEEAPFQITADVLRIKKIHTA